MKEDNRSIYPQWQSKKQFYEAWYLKLNRKKEMDALWLRFQLLKTLGYTQGHVWAVYFPKPDTSSALVVNEGLDLSAFPFEVGLKTDETETIIKFANSSLSQDRTSGKIDNSHHIAWDLQFIPDERFSFHYAPPLLGKVLSSKAGTPNVNTEFSGRFSVNNEEFICQNEPGSQGHYYGKKYARSWAWSHCNFFDEVGSNTVFEIIDVKAAGYLPRFKSAYIKYKGQDYIINGFSNLLFAHSKYKMGEWVYICHMRPFTFKIQINTPLKRIADVEYKDVDDSKLVCHNTKQAHSVLTVFENKKVIDKYTSWGTTAFEIVDRK